jgi:hypothetical protein
LKVLEDPSLSLEDQKDLESKFRHSFPGLTKELKGMIAGARKNGVRIASFSALFRVILGEVLDWPGGCSSIAAVGRHANFLAHNEEGTSILPLCFAKVSLRLARTSREFLSVSYPFQLFGSAVGANAKIAFTGNSITMNELIENSWSKRIPKAVLTRLMLECQSIDEIKDTLRSYHAVLPSHWYVASASKIISIQMRPRAGSSIKERNSQIRVSPVRKSSCHTNHFQSGEKDGWCESEEYLEESVDRLKLLYKFEKELGPIRQRPETRIARLENTLKKLRHQTVGGVRGTLATISIAVDKEETRMRAFDYFSKRDVGLESVSTPRKRSKSR